MAQTKQKIGFIGQGFIGKNYADDFENRGHEVVRYALDEPYVKNKETVKECDIVFIAVPTPTIPTEDKRNDGNVEVHFDDRIVREAVDITGEGSIVVIKSTIVPGTTESIQKEHPNKIILHSPEFLSETTAKEDAANPKRNIVGYALDTEKHKKAAEQVLSLLPKAPYVLICDALTAEHIKYVNNGLLFVIVDKNGGDWEMVREAVGADPRVGPSHLDPRGGAGRSCFIKDFGALSEMYTKLFPDEWNAIMAMRGFEYKNAELLRNADRYIDLLEGVYGKGAGIKKDK
jgi:UDP-glucose 6-dehydrogenase